jgi:hypothetical protein
MTFGCPSLAKMNDDKSETASKNVSSNHTSSSSESRMLVSEMSIYLGFRI